MKEICRLNERFKKDEIHAQLWLMNILDLKKLMMQSGLSTISGKESGLWMSKQDESETRMDA